MKLTNPKWVKSLVSKYDYSEFRDVPAAILDDIKNKYETLGSGQPDVSIIIPAFNEEVNILRCIESILDNVTEHEYEIIVVNNNSQDRTQEALDSIGIPNYFQGIQGCGPARQIGQENAKGKYILLADADSLYPTKWIDSMIDKLTMKGVSCVYGLHSFYGSSNSTRWQLALYEVFRNIIYEIRHIKRPFINALGMNMAYIKDYGLEIGWLDINIRGDDGRMCFDLMKYGSVIFNRSTNSRVWTGDRTLIQDGSLAKSFIRRVVRDIAHLDTYFKKMMDHDTKKSSNPDESLNGSINILKQKVGTVGRKKEKDA